MQPAVTTRLFRIPESLGMRIPTLLCIADAGAERNGANRRHTMALSLPELRAEIFALMLSTALLKVAESMRKNVWLIPIAESARMFFLLMGLPKRQG
jgi:hypothetical protein